MYEKDIKHEIQEKAKKDGTNPIVVSRDYVIGVMSSASEEVFRAIEKPGQSGPIIGGGISLRKGHYKNFPRNTDDIDFTAGRDFFQRDGREELNVYADDIRQVAEVARDRIRAVHGRNFLPSDFVVSGIRKTPSRNGNDGGTMRARIEVPGIYGGSKVNVDFETNTSRDPRFFTIPERKPVIHPFSDSDELRLGEISVFPVGKTHGDKLYAFLERLTADADASKFSRMKDIFDTWFITQQEDNQEYLRYFANRVEEERGFGHDTEKIKAVIQRAAEDPIGFKIWLADLVRKGIKNMEGATDDQAIRRTVSGLIVHYSFPSGDALASTFAEKMKKIQEII